MLALLGILGLARLPRERLLFGILACGSAIVLNLFKYTRTWDIVKFGNALALCLGVGAGGLVYRVLQKQSARWLCALVLAGAILAVWGGLHYCWLGTDRSLGVAMARARASASKCATGHSRA